jgi:SAM-dependent MidA family methyltransferase
MTGRRDRAGDAAEGDGPPSGWVEVGGGATPPGDAGPRPVADWVEVGIRRVEELRPEPLPASNPTLARRIADEIRRSGPMTFARFMHRALYELDLGYYESRDRGPGREGDFLTAPESHPIFGWTIARQLEEVWDRLDRPARFVVREHGAGSGALAAGILDGLRRSGSALLEAVRYQPIDAARPRLDALRERLAAGGLERHLEPADGRPEPGAVVANELLDALPVHLVEGAGTTARPRLLERFVVLAPGADAEGGDALPTFSTVLGPPSTPDLAERLAAEGVALEPGQPAEICLGLDEWIERAAAPLARGLVLLLDYGAPANELYAPGRGSTLRAYYRHRVHADPFAAIGRQDLTAHVDLTAVERAAAATGLTLAGRARQSEFLVALGLGDLLVALQSDLGTTLETYLEARSAAVRMLDPKVTGGFAVLAFARDMPSDPPMRGFTPPR